MNRCVNLSLFVFFMLWFSTTQAQVLRWSPAFPSESDSVTIWYNASLGNAALNNTTTAIYAHTGVITNLSVSSTNWRHVIFPWTTNDPKAQLLSLGNNMYQIGMRPRTFYNVPSAESIDSLAFVFRDPTGSTVGRSATGNDLYIPIYNANVLNARVENPKSTVFSTLGDSILFFAIASKTCTLSVFVDNQLQSTTVNDSIEHTIYINTVGKHVIRFEATDGMTNVVDTKFFVVNAPLSYSSVPANIKTGINYTSDTTATLALIAPNKRFIYVVGEFNNWEPDPNYFMNYDSTSFTWWLPINGLVSGKEYGYQYYIDGELKLADPYCEKVLDPWNDSYIDTLIYPNPKPYPSGFANGIVSVLQTNQSPYQWQWSSYNKPDEAKLVIYELLVRDFSTTSSFQSVIDSIEYLKKLGVNCIELMPVNEFEGNDSWGYNPSFYFATDKAYGTKNKFKELIDICHKNNIAVVIDMVLNHSFGLSPMVQMYWDGNVLDPCSNTRNGGPSTDNPWFNGYAYHPFNVGYDMNHESDFTKKFVKDVCAFWINEYQVDGYRFDLSKGFTQKFTCDVGVWGQYDAVRIATWKRIYDEIKAVDSTTYIILEHFADNTEERELANYGMLFWGNLNGSYRSIAKGFSSNIDWASYKTRGWQKPKVVAYMESHDEERVMVDVLLNGAFNANYNIRNINTALDRIVLNSVFFYTIPGPKLIWQFGEYGYDVSINTNGRVGRKPVKWSLLNNTENMNLLTNVRAVVQLRNYDAFHTDNFNMRTSGSTKVINLNHSSMNVTILGNFNTIAANVNPYFQNTGVWYEYFKGDSITVNNVNDVINLSPGEYRIYSSKKLPKPNLLFPTSIAQLAKQEKQINVYPNPASDFVSVNFGEMPQNRILAFNLYNVNGQSVKNGIFDTSQETVNLMLTNNTGQALPNGVYILALKNENEIQTARILVFR